MTTEELGNSRILNRLFKPAGIMMESRLRVRLMNPVRTLNGAGIQSGQTVLEVGCGTGFFTIPAARLIGDGGLLVALDVLAQYTERVSEKIRDADLNNVRVIKRDALATGLDDGSMDQVLLFGVLPFPFLPLDRLLPEMHRILKPEGKLSVWMFPVSGWVPGSIRKSGLFTHINQRKGVYNYRRV